MCNGFTPHSARTIEVQGRSLPQRIAHLMMSVCTLSNIPYIIVAPTGKAASKLKGYTIHKVVFCYNNERSKVLNGAKTKRKEFIDSISVEHIKTEVLIIDETSMVDIEIVSEVLKLLKPNSRLTMVGDDLQLPSIGVRDLLRYVMQSGVITTNKIILNKRMDKDLNVCADIIRNDKLDNNTDIITHSPHCQITMMDINNMSKNDLVEKVMGLWKKHIKEDDATSFQFITPYNEEKAENGANNYGKRMWDKLIHKELENGFRQRFVKGEKLICTKTHTDKESNQVLITKGTI
jgi:exodeoxyribonuclease V alpha subunit